MFYRETEPEIKVKFLDLDTTQRYSLDMISKKLFQGILKNSRSISIYL